MPAQTGGLFLVQDLQDSNKIRDLADDELNAMRTIADWIKAYVVMPHKDLGRGGPVCPFVGKAMEHNTLWLAAEQIADRGATDVVQLVNDYKERLLRAEPVQGDAIAFKAIVVALTGVSAERASDILSDALSPQLLNTSYAQDGVVIGQFHERNEGTAIYNPDFHPFRSPVPFVLLRHAHVTDWKFFIDDEEWLGVWAGRFPGTAVPALAGELRRTNWRHLES